MIIQEQLDDLVEELNNYYMELQQLGFDQDTIFAAFAIMAASLSGKKVKRNKSSDVIKERMKELKVLNSRMNKSIH